MKAIALRAAIVAALPLFCLSAVAAEGPLAQKKGQGGSEIQGSAGPGGSQGDNGLEHCDKPMGAMAVVEPQDYVAQSLSRYGLQSPTGLIRMMVQQSNCFIVVERGIGMQNMMQERALQESGELRQNSNMGGGQMVSADFVLTPAVVFSENNAGGVGGALGGLLGGKSGTVLGAVAGGLKFKEAQTSMLVADARSGVQVAAAEGSSKKADLRARRRAVRRQCGRRPRRLRQHQRRQGDRGQPHGQLQQRRQVGAQPAEPAARRRHARGRSGQEGQERRGVQRRRHDRAEDRQREAVRLAGRRRRRPSRRSRRATR